MEYEPPFCGITTMALHIYLLHLSEDDASLPLNLLFTEGWVGQDVRENLNSILQVVGQTLGVEHGLFPKIKYKWNKS